MPPSGLLVELYITSVCNQKCEYCYLARHGDKLYPPEIRDESLILHNLDILINYAIQEQLYLPRIDLFSGEILGTPLGDKILNALLAGIDHGLRFATLCIPTNFSFCLSPQTTQKIENYIEQFRQRDINVNLSCSMDGLAIDRINRPFVSENDKKKTIDYYTRIISFCKTYGYGFHPMIAASGIEQQIENYRIWRKIIKGLCPTTEDLAMRFGSVMQLEVRNDDWTDEKIVEYLKWLNYVIDSDLEDYFNNDINVMAERMYLDTNTQIHDFLNSFIPYRLSGHRYTYSCTFGSMLSIRLGDLAIVPCHRTSYEQFLLGKFKVENEQITGVTCLNLPLANAVYNSLAIYKPECDICPIAPVCIKGCIGSQYESSKDLFYPIESVCNLEQAKWIFLCYKFSKLGLFKHPNFMLLKEELKTMLTQLFEQKESSRKWLTIAQQIA